MKGNELAEQFCPRKVFVKPPGSAVGEELETVMIKTLLLTMRPDSTHFRSSIHSYAHRESVLR